MRGIAIIAVAAALAPAACKKTGNGEYTVQTPHVSVSTDTTTVRTPTVGVVQETSRVVTPELRVHHDSNSIGVTVKKDTHTVTYPKVKVKPPAR